jgi:hypothetical protein
MSTSDRSLRTPSLRRHKPSQRGVVTLNGVDVYLGLWPNRSRQAPPETRNAYDRLISEWLANSRRLPGEDPAKTVTVEELILAFWRYAEQHYRHDDGTATNELNDYRLSLRPLRQLYGTLRAADFSPLKLKAVRQRMIDAKEYRVRSTDPQRPWEAWVSAWVEPQAERPVVLLARAVPQAEVAGGGRGLDGRPLQAHVPPLWIPLDTTIRLAANWRHRQLDQQRLFKLNEEERRRQALDSRPAEVKLAERVAQLERLLAGK